MADILWAPLSFWSVKIVLLVAEQRILEKSRTAPASTASTNFGVANPASF